MLVSKKVKGKVGGVPSHTAYSFIPQATTPNIQPDNENEKINEYGWRRMKTNALELSSTSYMRWYVQPDKDFFTYIKKEKLDVINKNRQTYLT